MKNIVVGIFTFFLFVFFSCSKDVGKLNRGNYPYEVGKIIVTSCAVEGCHNGSSYRAASDLNLETWRNLFNGSSNGSPVIPYNSKYSSLCYFINTYSDLGLQNTPIMPLNGKPLSYDQVKVITDWINSGAPDIDGNIMWSDPNMKKFYAANQGCDVVTVFDAETQLPMRYIKVGNKLIDNTPHQLRVSPDGKFWYVIFVNTNIMQKFRCSDDSHVGDIPLSPKAAGTGAQDDINWNTFVITKDGKRAYCASLAQNGRVCAVDLENLKLIHYSPVMYFPHGTVLNATEDKLYVAAQNGNFMTELDTSFSDAKTITLDNSTTVNYSSTSLDPHDMILSPDAQNIMITCQNSNDVRVYNFAQQKITNIISTGIFPQEIVYSKTMNQYFVSCTEDYTTLPGATGILTRITANGYATTNIKCGYQPHGLAVDETKKLLYVLSRNISANGPLPHHTTECVGRNGFVNFVDLNTYTVLPKKYELSADPYFIIARP